MHAITRRNWHQHDGLLRSNRGVACCAQGPQAAKTGALSVMGGEKDARVWCGDARVVGDACGNRTPNTLFSAQWARSSDWVRRIGVDLRWLHSDRDAGAVALLPKGCEGNGLTCCNRESVGDGKCTDISVLCQMWCRRDQRPNIFPPASCLIRARLRSA